MCADLDALRERTERLLERVASHGADDDIAEAVDQAEALRNARQHADLVRLAEAVSRRRPDHVRNRRLYAQALIELGQASVAIDVLESAAKGLPGDDPEFGEVHGLLGRASKQIFFDASDSSSTHAIAALKKAIAAYRKPWALDPANTWHGVNLVALLSRAQRLGVRAPGGLRTKQVASSVVEELDKVPAAKRDGWHQPTLAEASLGLDDWDAVEAALKTYVAQDDVPAFYVASTLRQFRDVWAVEKMGERGQGLVDVLRARLLQLSKGALTLSAGEVRGAQRRDPVPGQLEAILGDEGTSTWLWYKKGLESANAVCAIRTELGGRIGTGWLVSSDSLKRAPAELFVMTNFHVVNKAGAAKGITPDAAEVVFEAVDPNRVHRVKEIVWSSDIEHHDCSLLRLDPPVEDIKPLEISATLPLLTEGTPRVYIIGHPGGRELAFSLRDNDLIDHEGPPATPAIQGVCRVHYRAPTEGGSSGSPVFNSSSWRVIALHHMGGKTGMSRLNGKPGTYAANEGISLASIVEAMGK